MPITVSGTSITFNDATTQTTAFTGGGGTVTSVATGNGLSGGTITTSGTLVVACPSFNSVGSYCFAGNTSVNGSWSSGATYSAGTGNNQIQSISMSGTGFSEGTYFTPTSTNNLSGTWRCMAGPVGYNTNGSVTMACRVS